MAEALWLRLERRVHQSAIAANCIVSSVPSGDTAKLSNDFSPLFDASESEVRVETEFTVPLPLGTLRTLLSILMEESPNYNLYSENCYFFCAVIYEALVSAGSGVNVAGAPSDFSTFFGSKTKARIKKRMASSPSEPSSGSLVGLETPKVAYIRLPTPIEQLPDKFSVATQTEQAVESRPITPIEQLPDKSSVATQMEQTVESHPMAPIEQLPDKFSVAIQTEQMVEKLLVTPSSSSWTSPRSPLRQNKRLRGILSPPPSSFRTSSQLPHRWNKWSRVVPSPPSSSSQTNGTNGREASRHPIKQLLDKSSVATQTEQTVERHPITSTEQLPDKFSVATQMEQMVESRPITPIEQFPDKFSVAAQTEQRVKRHLAIPIEQLPDKFSITTQTEQMVESHPTTPIKQLLDKSSVATQTEQMVERHPITSIEQLPDMFSVATQMEQTVGRHPIAPIKQFPDKFSVATQTEQTVKRHPATPIEQLPDKFSVATQTEQRVERDPSKVLGCHPDGTNSREDPIVPPIEQLPDKFSVATQTEQTVGRHPITPIERLLDKFSVATQTEQTVKRPPIAPIEELPDKFSIATQTEQTVERHPITSIEQLPEKSPVAKNLHTSAYEAMTLQETKLLLDTLVSVHLGVTPLPDQDHILRRPMPKFDAAEGSMAGDVIQVESEAPPPALNSSPSLAISTPEAPLRHVKFASPMATKLHVDDSPEASAKATPQELVGKQDGEMLEETVWQWHVTGGTLAEAISLHLSQSSPAPSITTEFVTSLESVSMENLGASEANMQTVPTGSPTSDATGYPSPPNDIDPVQPGSMVVKSKLRVKLPNFMPYDASLPPTQTLLYIPHTPFPHSRDSAFFPNLRYPLAPTFTHRGSALMRDRARKRNSNYLTINWLLWHRWRFPHRHDVRPYVPLLVRPQQQDVRIYLPPLVLPQQPDVRAHLPPLVLPQ
ncbi:hypothetical protein BS47DRAFT_1367752 [Hydnum rufescens UP504]|uniref:Uncharacterized protein n=1 Tax=Hydnum rufescens UP504 TaxID=1448309 RepID=A0A9P6DP41_9AGAM|nr:hypothetical protein BS47DRAFT_1367752 [Hydnum rufescens UP504]